MRKTFRNTRKNQCNYFENHIKIKLGIFSTKFIYQKSDFHPISIVKSQSNAVAWLNGECVCVSIQLTAESSLFLYTLTHSHTLTHRGGRKWGVKFDPAQLISPADNVEGREGGGGGKGEKKEEWPNIRRLTNSTPLNSNFQFSPLSRAMESAQITIQFPPHQKQ